MTSRLYDLFISYNRQDEIIVEYVVKELKDIGIKLYFDKDEMRPGGTWILDIHRNINHSNAVAVFIGKHGIGNWQGPEIRKAIDNFVIKGGSIIPIILEGANEKDLPPFLEQNNYIDFRDHKLDLNKFKNLIWGITGRRLVTIISALGEEFLISVKRENNHDKTIKVFPINNLYRNRLKHISWADFGRGIDNLVEQIQDNGSSLNVDICVGINDAGLNMATYINSKCFNRGFIGYLRTKKIHNVVEIAGESLLPDLPEKPTIMIFDFEIKYADVLTTITKFLKEKYIEPQFYFCVFGAMTESEDLKIRDLEELVSYNQILENRMQDVYIAATMHPPGIEPPLEIK